MQALLGEGTGGEGLEGGLGGRGGSFGTGKFDEDTGLFADDDGTEKSVVGAGCLGRAHGSAVEVGAGGGDEHDLGAAEFNLLLLDLGLAVELADPAIDVGIDAAALAAEVVELGFQGSASFNGVIEDGLGHHAGVLALGPRLGEGKGELADGEFGGLFSADAEREESDDGEGEDGAGFHRVVWC